jgi:hypothetical protein
MTMADFDHGYTEYQSNRSALRKLVRRAYLRSARAQLRGATLDFGCGVGELLSRLPAGSMGLEYNQATVEHCRGKGLSVCWYDGMADDWQLSAVPPGRRFESMVVSHVLEHLDEPMSILQRLLLAGRRLGIGRVLVIVPGRAGYRIDSTHRTFVDRAMLVDPEVTEDTGFSLERARYFPGNVRSIGDWFPHHELQALYVAEGKSANA